MARTASKTWFATCCCSSRFGSALTGNDIGSPNWIVTLGMWKRFQARTPSEPWIATGITGAPDSSAILPTPRLGSPRSPVRVSGLPSAA